MATTIITTKGQIVIPSKIRAKYKIKKGTKFCVRENGSQIILQPLTKEYFHKMAGVLQNKKKLSQELLEARSQDKESEEKKCKK